VSFIKAKITHEYALFSIFQYFLLKKICCSLISVYTLRAMSIVIIMYLLAILAVVYFSKHSNRREEYFIANRSLSAWQVGASIAAAITEPLSVLFMFGVTYLFGGAGVGLYITYIITASLLALIAPRVHTEARQSGALTISDLIYAKLGRYSELCYALIASLFAFGTIVTLYSAGVTIVGEVADVRPTVIVIAFFLITLLYVLIGGYRSVVRTDVLQFVLMLVVFGSIALAATSVGTIERAPGTWFAGAFWMFAPVLLFQNITKPAAWLPVMAARSPEVAKRGVFYGALMQLVLIAPIVAASLTLRSTYPDADPMSALFALLSSEFGVLAFTAVAVAFLAAFMSSLDTALLFIGGTLVRSARRVTGEMSGIRVVILSVAALAIALALVTPDFLALIMNIVPLIGVSTLPLFLAIFAREVHSKHEDMVVGISMIAGVVAFAYLFIYPPAQYIVNIVPALLPIGLYVLWRSTFPHRTTGKREGV